MTARHWMPLYIADYLADTAHLSTAEHGAYILLIMHYWTKGSLPQDEDTIRRITRMTVRQWSRSRDLLRSLFGADWSHKRCDHEIAQAVEKSKVNSANARRSHVIRSANAQRTHTQSQSQSESQSEVVKKETREVAPFADPPDFDEFWGYWPHKVGKPAALKAYASAMKRGAKPSEILDGMRGYIDAKPPDRPWLNPATFLNQNRWEDQPATIRQQSNGKNNIIDAFKRQAHFVERTDGDDLAAGRDIIRRVSFS